MRHPILLAACLLAQLATATAALAEGLPSSARDRRFLYGLTADQRLVWFKSTLPSFAKSIGSITNLSGDAKLLGIDFRPATGELWALGDQGGLYVIDTKTAEASFRAQATLSGAPFVPSGAAFGVDFNPTVDRLRVVSDTGQNLRINVDTGAVTSDPGLNVGSPAVPATGVVGAAYTNNDADPASGTTLFDLDLDSATDQLLIQAPPNAGVLNLTGNLGPDASGDAGFDIVSVVRGGLTVDVIAYATLTTDATRLYEIDLFTGRATSRGAFTLTSPVIGLAIPLDVK
jgi:hypothetical protein